VQKLEPLGHELAQKDVGAREVAAGPIEACDETALDRIDGGLEHDGDRGGRGFRGPGCRLCECHDHIHMTGNELGKLLKAIGAGDVLVVTRLDRLARSTLDLLSILRRLADAGAKFKSLRDPWADTTAPHGELIVTILTGLATLERHLIKVRIYDGNREVLLLPAKESFSVLAVSFTHDRSYKAPWRCLLGVSMRRQFCYVAAAFARAPITGSCSRCHGALW
jgi:hypothetical protein